jgi:biotin carboxyl carrier protein
MKYLVNVLGKNYEVEVNEISPLTFEVVVNGKRAIIEVQKKLEVKTAEVKPVEVKKVEEKPVPKVEGKVITAPMAGVVTKILKKEGDEVKEGETVLIIEAMKMENPINSPFSGVIEKIAVEEGEKVANGAPLVYVK